MTQGNADERNIQLNRLHSGKGLLFMPGPICSWYDLELSFQPILQVFLVL